MLEAAVVVYGMLVSFVLSGASRNRRAGRANPPALERVGYVLCGTSAGASALLVASLAAGATLVA